MCIHTDGEMQNMEAKQEAVSTRNENGFDHSATMPEDAVDVNFEKVEKFAQNLMDSTNFQDGKFSKMVETLFVGLSKKELSVMAAESIVAKYKGSQDPFMQLMSQVSEH